MSKIKVLTNLLIAILLFGMGLFAGIGLGQQTIVEKTVYALSGSTFIVNFNETKLVEEMNKTIVVPMTNKILGQIKK